MEPKVLFEDEAMVVIDKPAGMIVNRAQSVTAETIQDWFGKKYNIGEGEGEFYEKGGVVHRLDKDTSGVMVLAKTPEAYAKLKQQFLERQTRKRYVALVHGRLKEKEGIITQPLMRHPRDRHKFTVGGEPARAAITNWRVLEEREQPGPLTLLELEPHTGRTHQLRVHLQYIGHPIVSDPIYGWAKKVGNDFVWCPRLFLHAKYLEFTHPTTGKKVSFESDLPAELASVLH